MGRSPSLRWVGLGFCLLILVSGAALLRAVYTVPLPARLSEASSPSVLYQDGTVAYVALAPDDRWRLAFSLEEVDANYLKALLALEDQRFWYHFGVDPIAVVRAALSNISQGRIVSGASTLTMQLVRMVEPRPRTFRSKVEESFRAIQLELLFSKKEILELYLQYLPFGGNIEGLEAASLAYFGHRADALTEAEIAILLAVPQAPTSRHPSPENAQRLKAARSGVVARLLASEQSLLDEPSLRAIEQTAVPDKMLRFPRHVMHGAPWLLGQDNRQLHSTLDRQVQLLAQRVLKRHRAWNSARGIHNGAVVVIEHQDMSVRGMVGNFDFWDDENGGQIPGFAKARSVGSTLKPFIYAMAIDEKLALPGFLVPDIPHRYGAYEPKNFNGQFDGLVRLEQALSRSLNIPFVTLLQKLKTEKFLGRLRLMGAQTLNDAPDHYGLSVAAGGIALSPIELASFFAVLARGGEYMPLQFEVQGEDVDLGQGIRVFSPGATALTRAALSLKDRPDFPRRRTLSDSELRIHWKTGTSFGHRDAWSIGSNSRYTVAIWLGNFDYRASKALVGSEAAGPILFDLLEALPDGHKTPSPGPMASVDVCSYSGRVASDACPQVDAVLAPRNSIPSERCPYHIRLDVDDETGLALTPLCRVGRSYTSQSFVTLPATMRRWMKGSRLLSVGPPSFMEGCQLPDNLAAPSVVSPAEGEVITLLKGLDASQQEVPLEVETHGAASTISWFVDGQYLGDIASDERLWWTPSLGSHQIVATDGAGNSGKRSVTVKLTE